MENKLNLPELQQYSKQLARKLCRDYFNLQKRTIDGKEILKFTEIEQTNYFILKILFGKWKEEIAQLKQSAFFNYEHPEIETALQNFAVLLSNHIAIKHDQFELLLAQALEETIYLSLSPYHYFKIYYFTPDKDKITLYELKEKAKYLKMNASFFNHFIEKLETYRIPAFQVADIMGYFQESYYSTNDTFDSYEPIINHFSSLLPLELDKIVSDLKKKDDYAPTPLELFEDRKKDINNAIVEVQTMAPSTNITPIKLSLNQRIMFLRELFNNDIEKMEHTMARLEAAGSFDNANYIISFFNWDKENEAVQEFQELIKAKYR